MAKLEVLAVPAYLVTMGAEYVHHRRRAEGQGRRMGELPGDYETRDSLTSLTLGGVSLIVPLVAPKVLRAITPGKGRHANKVVAAAVGAAVVTTVADVVARRAQARLDAEVDAEDTSPPSSAQEVVARETRRRRRSRVGRARKVAGVGGVTTLAAGGVAAATGWDHLTRPHAMWNRRILPDLGSGPLGWTVAMVGWDFLYYWNHRIWHETRFLWANHVMHHSSERYNLSTALRQSVTDPFLIRVPYNLLSLLGVRPAMVATSRSLNLLYQYWVHTDAINRLGRYELVGNTPSHHRAHHGVNPQYIDRNHGGILIVWDRLFGTFEPEDEAVVFGLTANIDSFSPLVAASHEYRDIFRDVARSTNWSDRFSFVFRGPGWAYERHRTDAERRALTGSTPARPVAGDSPGTEIDEVEPVTSHTVAIA